MSYNYNIYANKIKYFVPYISKDDLYWLCNQAGKLYKKLDDGCTDNFRCCAGTIKSVLYKKAEDQGCCGFCDRLIRNPKTGNIFWIGFNYGH